MILDYTTNPDFASRFDVIDLDTGQPVARPYFYADDAAGVLRHYVRDESGNILMNADPTEPRWEEVTDTRIRIVPKGRVVTVADIEILPAGTFRFADGSPVEREVAVIRPRLVAGSHGEPRREP